MTDPADMAQRQLDAYNAHDLEAFAACYHEDVEVRDFPAQTLRIQGRAELRARYGPLFEKHPELHAELVQRSEQGAVVVDKERVTGMGSEVVFALAIYEVEGDLIRRVWFARPREEASS